MEKQDTIQELETLWRKSITFEDYLDKIKIGMIAAVFKKGYATIFDFGSSLIIDTEAVFVRLLESNKEYLEEMFNKPIVIKERGGKN